MKTFKQKALLSALAGAGALVAATAANAVYVNPDGLGQVLIYPYYTVRGGNFTAISVVNTTEKVKAVKVRYLEGKNSKEVLDFNLFLSPKDVWTSIIEATPTGAKISTKDKSCTNPAIRSTGESFRNFEYSKDTGTYGETPLSSLDRTREGYLEILEMAEGDPATTIVGKAVVHTSGVPLCTASSINDAAITGAAGAELTVPAGGLFGSGSIINFDASTVASYDAVAFDGWSTIKQLTASGTIFPNLSNGDSKSSVVASGGKLYIAEWLSAIDAVSATIMRSHVMGEYAYTKDGVIGTEWVVTFPTKNQYVTDTAFKAPFSSKWSGGENDKGLSCDSVSLTSYDREEGLAAGGGDDFSPRLTEAGNALCWEANVIKFGPKSDSLGAMNVVSIEPHQMGDAVDTAGGWLDLSFTSAAPAGVLVSETTNSKIIDSTGVAAPDAAQSYVGLPVLGFTVSTLKYETGSPLKNYASSYQLRYKRDIKP